MLTFENEGKNKGCWVMRRAGSGVGRAPSPAEAKELSTGKEDDLDALLTKIGTSAELAPKEKPAEEIAEEDQKVIVRSNGTVGYVGKDIAYHMWKFGLLGRDFGYRKFYRYPNGHDCWISTAEGEPRPPSLRRCCRNLQRDRCPPVRGAEHGDRGLERSRTWRRRRSPDSLLIRHGRAHSAAAPLSWATS